VVALGNVTLASINDWDRGPGSVVSWHPSPGALAKARQAPISSVPPSHQQARHIHNFCEHAPRGFDMSRLCIMAWDIVGRCDIRAMTFAINAHLRRHDTYRSWFECNDAKHIVRHTIREPADIEFVPTRHDEIPSADWRDHVLATPDPLHWDCFRFWIIQRSDHFTFCACIDHLHVDAMFTSVVFAEFHMMYAHLMDGKGPIPLPDPGSYDDYCVRQREFTSALTSESPEVRAWIQFFENNGGTLPDCPVSLGDGSGSCGLMAVPLLDERQTAEFENICMAAGARFSGGVFACAALAEYELTGAETYYGIIATDTRSTPADFMTTGWFTGFVPITVPITGSSFGDTARDAQESFDSAKELGRVPWGRVLELVPWLRMPQGRVPLLFYLDAGIPPLSAFVSSQLDGLNARAYHDGRVPTRFDIRVNRFEKETHAVVLFPNNPVARESVIRYLAALKSVYVRVAEDRGAVAPLRGS
jgi:mycolipenoyl-CoA---2-(long-chain-fatty acyl)-trehalose mycolipenoyltransferase / long-chain-acyl-CoA---trehalose acyltransferase